METRFLMMNGSTQMGMEVRIVMIAIVAADRDWGIGRDGRLPWRLPGDLAYFRERTMGGVVVMGRRTFESFAADGAPAPLPGRTNVVLTRDADYATPGAAVARSVGELFELLRGFDSADGDASPSLKDKNNIAGRERSAMAGTRRKVFVCGGANIYRLLMPHTDICLVTRIDFASGADTFFPVIEEGARVAGDGGLASPGFFTANTPDGAGRRFALSGESAPVTEKDLLGGRTASYRFCEYRVDVSF
jgi:dihydrofolate reductase